MKTVFWTVIIPILCYGILGNPVDASAQSAIRIQPGNTARFLPDQRFDVRIEFEAAHDTTFSQVSVAIDGKSIPIAIDALDADGGITLRNIAVREVGRHEIKATAVESGRAQPIVATSTFEIVRVAGSKKRYRNVIICLGDGMGISHRTAARIVRFGYEDGKPLGKLAMDEFPVTGMVMTSSLNSNITDSAPGMSSYATGNKAQNDAEGVFPDNTQSPFDNPRVEYLSGYMARKLGKSLGIVTTADVEDATPAANAVHTSNRDLGTGICDQYFDEREHSGLSVLLGGGRRWFLPNSVTGSSRSDVSDYQLDPATAKALGVEPGRIDPTRDLLADFQSAGFAYAASKTDLDRLVADKNTTKLLGLFGFGNMNVAYDKIAKRRDPSAHSVVDDYLAPDQPMLYEMADAALSVLNKNPKGFVLLVEGAHIDKQSHMMDADRAIWDTIEFDRAVKVCRDFAEHDGNTLVIVVSDHECGGFSVIGSLKKSLSELRSLPSDADNVAPRSVDPKTGKMGPAPARQAAVGIYEEVGFPRYQIAPDGFPVTADIEHRILIGFGANADRFETWLAKPLPVIDSLLDPTMKKTLANGADHPEYAPRPIDREERRTGLFLRGQVPGSTAVHTASDVPISAFGGKAAEQFAGVQDNTDVFFKLARALLGGY